MNEPPPPYVLIGGTQNGQPTAPHHRAVVVPGYPPGKKKKSGGRSCLRCICCCYCLLILLVIIIAASILYFYTMYHPQVPSYNVENFQVKAFNVLPDFSLVTRFLVTVKAENPNTAVGFIYGEDSSVHVVYTDSDLCTGKLPSFHQGHRNVTMMEVDLNGKSEFGSGLQEALMESRKNHKIPLLVKVRVPVQVVVAEIPLRQLMVFVNISLVVDNLAPNKPIGILSSNTTFDIEF